MMLKQRNGKTFGEDKRIREVNRIRGRYYNRDEEKQRIEMKRSREKLCNAEEEENIYVYILLLELNNLKLRSSRHF